MGQETILSGVTTSDCRESCIYGDGVDFTVENCIIKDSFYNGIYSKNGNVDIRRCTIHSNAADGIYHEGAGFVLNVDTSWLLRNGEHGIRSQNSTPQIRSCIVSESDFLEAGNAGVRIESPASQPKLYNNTISNNKAEGIFFYDADPNYMQSPDYLDIHNCLIFFNNSNGDQVRGLNPDDVAM